MTGRRYVRAAALFMACGLAAVIAPGCSSAPARREHPHPDPLIKGQITQDKVERALRMKVERHLEYVNANKDRFQAEVVRTRIRGENYYYRFYDWFPGKAEQIQVRVEESAGDNPPVAAYEGFVTYPRVRYETLYAGSAGRIRSTDNFVRDEGIQKERYEFTGDIWELRDAYFEVQRTSIYRDDRWVPVERRIRRVEEKRPEYLADKIRNFFLR